MEELMKAMFIYFINEKGTYNHIDKLEFTSPNSRLYTVIRSFIVGKLLRADARTRTALVFLKNHESRRYPYKDWFIDCFEAPNKELEISKLMTTPATPVINVSGVSAMVTQ